MKFTLYTSYFRRPVGQSGMFTTGFQIQAAPSNEDMEY
jgi:hypothetical protein